MNKIRHNILKITLFCLAAAPALPLQAALRTHPLTYNRLTGTGQLSGTVVIDDSSVTFSDSIQSTGGSLPGFINSFSLTYTDSSNNATNFDSSDFFGLRLQKVGANVDFTQDLVGQLSTFTFIAQNSGTTPTDGGGLIMGFNLEEYELASTPSPLGFLGIAGMFGISRAIRKKFKNNINFSKK